ncbi:MAG: CPBP family intramembrane metalloprotease [Lachnospiraceae bacterium]|nr:CPBP family intramembrane metalloprotease [Lachnospiraceae bacterium]
MKKLYEKNELHFSLIWIVLYVVLFGAADTISISLGTEKLITVPLCIVMSLLLWGWIKKNGATEKYGLGRFTGNVREYLYLFPSACQRHAYQSNRLKVLLLSNFLPLILISTTNLWGGFTLTRSPLETVLYMTSMLCVGFLEEVIFRGFLFKALCKDNVRTAFVVSSILFGIGHIVNLLNGAEVFQTLLQIVYAAAVGFMYTAVFYKGKSLVPCIISHAVINMTSVFATAPNDSTRIITTIALTVISIGYAIVLLKPKKV